MTKQKFKESYLKKVGKSIDAMFSACKQEEHPENLYDINCKMCPLTKKCNCMDYCYDTLIKNIDGLKAKK